MTVDRTETEIKALEEEENQAWNDVFIAKKNKAPRDEVTRLIHRAETMYEIRKSFVSFIANKQTSK